MNLVKIRRWKKKTKERREPERSIGASTESGKNVTKYLTKRIKREG